MHEDNQFDRCGRTLLWISDHILHRALLFLSHWIYRIQICRITHALIFYILGFPVPSSGLCSSCSIQTE
ncbi:hypothetical protein ACOSP7_024050 [Xanthoceras sorbifolium]